MKTHKQYIKELNNKKSEALHILYDLEDKTGYKNNNLGKAINLLQSHKVEEV